MVAASVKSDLLRHTLGAARAAAGCGASIRPAARVPGRAVVTTHRLCRVASVRPVAADLCDAAKADGTTPDGEFWYATAAKMLAPLLHAAALDGGTMADVVRWVDTQEVGEVAGILERPATPEALDAARATWCRDERTRSSVVTTAETVLAPFTLPPPGAPAPTPSNRVTSSKVTTRVPVRPGARPAPAARLLLGAHPAGAGPCLHAGDARGQGARPAAARRARRSRPHGAVARARRAGRHLRVARDPAGDRVAGPGPGQGAYGARAPTVLNNHRAKLFLPGIADPDTLEYASRLIGDEEVALPSVTRDPRGGRSTTSTTAPCRLLPPEELRCLPRGRGVLVYGTLPPARLQLRPWWATSRRRRLSLRRRP